MGSERLRVVLAMDTSLLASAIQQYLAGNPRLEVTVAQSGADGTAAPAHSDPLRTVRIGLLEDPVRFAFQSDGREWVMEYRSLDGLARVLADLAHANVVTLDRA